MSARRGGGRRGNVSEMVTIFWRDIPSQVTARSNGEKGSWLLEERFQVAIDRAAGVAGLTDADDYVAEWRRVTAPCEGDPQTAAQLEAERLQAAYPSERVRALVESGGLAASPAPPEDPEPHEDSTAN